MLEVVAVSQVFLKKKQQQNLMFASISSSTASVLDFYDNIWSKIIKYNWGWIFQLSGLGKHSETSL